MAEHTSYLRFLVCVWTHIYMGIDSGLRSEAIRLGGKVFWFLWNLPLALCCSAILEC